MRYGYPPVWDYVGPSRAIRGAIGFQKPPLEQILQRATHE